MTFSPAAPSGRRLGTRCGTFLLLAVAASLGWIDAARAHGISLGNENYIREVKGNYLIQFLVVALGIVPRQHSTHGTLLSLAKMPTPAAVGRTPAALASSEWRNQASYNLAPTLTQSVETKLVMRERTGALTVIFNGSHGWFWRKRTDASAAFGLRRCGNHSRIAAP